MTQTSKSKEMIGIRSDLDNKRFLVNVSNSDYGSIITYELAVDTEEIARASWNDDGEILIADDRDEAVAYANEYAPEHLEVNVAAEDEDRVVGALINYGSLFIGGNTAEVYGDYASGTNHTLPTLGAAR